LTLIDASFIHNMIVAYGQKNYIYTFDIEVFKITGILKLEINTEPTCLYILNELKTLLICTADARVFFFGFHFEDA